jgi:hypothetical protein
MKYYRHLRSTLLGLTVTALLAACTTSRSASGSSGRVDPKYASRSFNVALHLLVNVPTHIVYSLTSSNVDYKPTPSDTQRKQAVANARLLNEELIKGARDTIYGIAVRYGATISSRNSRSNVLDLTVLSSKMVCQDTVCRSFLEMKSDVLTPTGEVAWTYKSKIELPPGALSNDTSAFDNFAEDLLSAMKSDGLLGT